MSEDTKPSVVAEGVARGDTTVKLEEKGDKDLLGQAMNSMVDQPVHVAARLLLVYPPLAIKGDDIGSENAT